MPRRDMLLDVSRLVWRLWRGRHPTGIDRVALAYVERFRSRSQAVLHRRGRFFILNERHSDLLFEMFLAGPRGFRRKLIALALRAFASTTSTAKAPGLLYLNVSHTGLNEPSLGPWARLNRLRPIYLIHDLIPVSHPQYCRNGEDVKHRARMENALKTASGVIANSGHTLGELQAFATKHDLRMPPSVTAWIAGQKMEAPPAIGAFERPYFLVVGTIEGRKNHRLLLDIWVRLVAIHGKAAPILVIAGQRGWQAEDVIAILDQDAQLKGVVIEVPQCNDDELAALIAGARALLMPSFAEGFGLPVAEALAMGTPVIASDLEVFREFAGDIPTYLDPSESSAWQAAIEDFVGDSAERRRQLSSMTMHRPWGWDAHFKVVEAWLQTIPQVSGSRAR